jgi:hypothetical protein
VYLKELTESKYFERLRRDFEHKIPRIKPEFCRILAASKNAYFL